MTRYDEARINATIEEVTAGVLARLDGEPSQDSRSEHPGEPRTTRPTPDTISGFIDHSLFEAAATQQDIVERCPEAILHHFATVCINPGHVALAAQLLNGIREGNRRGRAPNK